MYQSVFDKKTLAIIFPINNRISLTHQKNCYVALFLGQIVRHVLILLLFCSHFLENSLNFYFEIFFWVIRTWWKKAVGTITLSRSCLRLINQIADAHESCHAWLCLFFGFLFFCPSPLDGPSWPCLEETLCFSFIQPFHHDGMILLAWNWNVSRCLFCNRGAIWRVLGSLKMDIHSIRIFMNFWKNPAKQPSSHGVTNKKVFRIFLTLYPRLLIYIVFFSMFLILLLSWFSPGFSREIALTSVFI